MKQLKKSLLIHVWEDYEFYLTLPHNYDGTNKPFVYFYYTDLQTKQKTRVRKYIGKHDGNLKKIKLDAKLVVTDIVELLDNNWNPISNAYNELQITPLSSINQCIDYWLNVRQKAFDNKAITASRNKMDKIIMMHFRDYLTKERLLNLRATTITSVHVKEFLDYKAHERNWGKVSYNTYRVDLGTFFNYLVDLTIIKTNPVNKAPKKTTKFDSSRFKIFEADELKQVAELLANDKCFSGLHIASKILFKYNIRPIEIIRLQVQDIDWDKKILNLPPSKTKNGNEANFLIDDEVLDLINEFIDGVPPEYYIFCQRNKPSPTQTFDDYFGQRWRAFRRKYDLPSHLKLYALKHTSNYYDLERGVSYEEIRQRNRHANLQVTTLYVRERLMKNVIKASESSMF